MSFNQARWAVGVVLLLSAAGVSQPALSQSGQASQQQAAGAIVGSVYDGATGDTVAGAVVEIDGDPTKRTVTDLNGFFRFDLPPGTYRLKLAAQNYFETTIDSVVVGPGNIVEASTVMSNTASGTTVDVVDSGTAAQATAQAMLIERKLSPVVSDSISKEELRESVASDAAGALEKVTGVSVVDDGFVYVRGLGERYSATMLNNAMMPTTDPEKRVVPLDMFPSSLIDSIKVLKTYTPDLPGEFSGGLVQMQTVEFPTARTLSVGVSSGFNTNTSFKPFDTYSGGNRDYFGFDDGTRNIPSLIPEGSRLFPGRFTEAEMVSFGRAFPVNYEPQRIDSMRPGQSFSISGGDTIKRLGLVGALTFNNSPSRRTELQRYLVNVGGGRAEVYTEYPNFVSNTETARLGGVLNAALRLSANHKVVFRNTITHESEKEARVFSGVNGGLDTTIQATRLRWVERGIYSGGVEGEHIVPRLGNSVFKWQMTYSQSSRNEPDLRETIRGELGDGRFAFLSLPQSGLRFYNKLSDRIYEPLGEYGKAFFKGRVSGLLKVGFRGTFRTRDFTARRFRFIPARADRLNFLLPTDELLSAENIRNDGFEIRENTRSTDTYEALMDVYGAFAMADLALGSRLRLVGGLRYEDARIEVETEDPLIPGAAPAVADLRNRDPLPGVNVIYALTGSQNLRFGYGRTLSRPDFRELSPFDFTNVLGGFNTVGNPDLQRATIDNFDARWEWFSGGDEVVAVSYFVKDFENPIEVTIQPTTDLRQSFVNASGARNQGFELELRRSLRFLGDRFIPFSVQSNFTFVDSNVEIPADQALLLTSRSRPLVGQSRYIFNVTAEWASPRLRSNARLFTNYVSRRLTDVGAFGLPDIYQEANTILDFVYQYQLIGDGKWNLRFAAENLTNNHFDWTQGGILQRSYRSGRSFSLGTTFSFF